MLRFAVYDDHGPASQCLLEHAFLRGADRSPVKSRVRFADGLIECECRGSSAMALNLQHDVERAGRLILQTCLLPQRDKPYLLSLELARERIKIFLAKVEEWQMTDIIAEHRAQSLWEEARQLFTRAMLEANPIKADKLARRSLARGVDATEHLAMVHAEILLHKRFANRPASSTTLGVRIWPQRGARMPTNAALNGFDVVMIPIPWNQLEIEEGRYDFETLDRWMNWAQRLNKPILAGPLLDFSRHNVPQWMYVWQNDYHTTRDLAYDHVERVVARYRGTVNIWNLASGININENFAFTDEQVVDLVRMANLHVRQSVRGARTMIELAQPFGDYVAERDDALAPLSFVEVLLHEGVRLDALGVQLLFGKGSDGQATRDLMQVSSFLDRLIYLELPVIISALGVPSEAVDRTGGWWHRPWSSDVQTRWASRVLPLVLSKPFVESVVWCNLTDDDASLLPHSGLITDDGKARPVFSRLVALRKRLRKPIGALKNLRTEPTETAPSGT